MSKRGARTPPWLMIGVMRMAVVALGVLLAASGLQWVAAPYRCERAGRDGGRRRRGHQRDRHSRPQRMPVAARAHRRPARVLLRPRRFLQWHVRGSGVPVPRHRRRFRRLSARFRLLLRRLPPVRGWIRLSAALHRLGRVGRRHGRRGRGGRQRGRWRRLQSTFYVGKQGCLLRRHPLLRRMPRRAMRMSPRWRQLHRRLFGRTDVLLGLRLRPAGDSLSARPP